MIDLWLAKKESNWQRPGYLDKLFVPGEQQQIWAAKDRDFLVWLFWSMKESAYKAWQRQKPQAPRFNPLEFHCQRKQAHPEMIQGRVLCGEITYATFSEFSGEQIHTWACAAPAVEIRRGTAGSRPEIRRKFLEEYSRSYGPFPKGLHLGKDRHFIPFLYHGDTRLDQVVSFSHHGRFSGFTYPLNNS